MRSPGAAARSTSRLPPPQAFLDENIRAPTDWKRGGNRKMGCEAAGNGGSRFEATLLGLADMSLWRQMNSRYFQASAALPTAESRLHACPAIPGSTVDLRDNLLPFSHM